MTFSWIYYFFRFGFSSSRKWHDIFMYSIYVIEESDVSQENRYNFIWYLKRDNYAVKTLFIVL